MAVALLTCLSTVDVLFVEITESVSTYREKHILNFTRLQFLYNDTNSLEKIRAMKDAHRQGLQLWGCGLVQGGGGGGGGASSGLERDHMADEFSIKAKV
jgi:hypothetical protein